MGKAKLIIGVAVVVVVIAALALALGGSSEKTPDVAYDYDVTMADSMGYDHAGEGNTYLIIDYVMENRGDEAISTNFMYVTWTATLDGVVYKQDDWVSVSHPDYKLVEIQPGAKATSGAVIEVPAGHSIEDFVIVMEYDDFATHILTHDDTLM